MKRYLLPLLILFLSACQKDDPAPNSSNPTAPVSPPPTSQSLLVGTWNVQTQRTQTTYTNKQFPDTDQTLLLTNTLVTYSADGKMTGTSNGVQTISGTYALDGTKLTVTVPGVQTPLAEVTELTASRLVIVSTEKKGPMRSVTTTTATR
ncbi:MAG TPA: lipocalin family protein [Hymenobacter sp.]